MITLDRIAHRYGLLPSEVLLRGTTLDLTILDLAFKWDRYQHNKSNGKATLNQVNLNQDEMKEMIAAVKRKKK